MQVKAEFDTREYVLSHGQPRGRGSWAFEPLEVNGPTTLTEGEPVFVSGSQTYTEARATIKTMYPEVTWWNVCP